MDRFNLTRKIALMGIAANLLLLVSKLAVGFASRSQAMIADGFNSAGDVFASVMTYIGNTIASKPEDTNHPYGHGKAEYIFSMIISLSLLLVAFQIFKSALSSILNREYFNFSWWLVGTAVGTILLKLALYIYTRRAGTKENNLLIVANSEDHRNDVLVTSSTLIGVYCGTKGIYWIDGAVGIGIALWIAFTGVRIFLSSYYVLMDTTIDNLLKQDVISTIKSVEGVDHVDSVTAKPVGVGFIIIVKVSVWGGMKVHEGHSVAAGIKERVKNFRDVKDVIVHINPA